MGLKITGVWTRIRLAFASLFTILFKGRLPAALDTVPEPAVSTPAVRPEQEPADQLARAVQALALLQREGRLVDFVMEDLASYTDAQVGAGVREVHAGCRRVLDRYVVLEPVLSGREGDSVTVGSDVDLAAVRLVGNVSGQPPFTGRLLHRGWRAARVELPPLGGDKIRSIVAQAEIELA